MRVISGKAKGRRISVPKGGHQLRATADRIKESLFNILHSVEGKYFLDLFAGTGSIGIEALSRSAEGVVFVDKNPQFIKEIKKNLKDFGFEENAELLTATIEKASEILFESGRRFDVIFADPPYEKDLVQETLDCLEKNAILKKSGIMIIEHSIRESFKWGAETIILSDQRKYGETMLSFFCHVSRKK